MIASSLREADEVVDLLLRKDADVHIKSTLKITAPLQTSSSPGD